MSRKVVFGLNEVTATCKRRQLTWKDQNVQCPLTCYRIHFAYFSVLRMSFNIQHLVSILSLFTILINEPIFSFGILHRRSFAWFDFFCLDLDSSCIYHYISQSVNIVLLKTYHVTFTMSPSSIPHSPFFILHSPSSACRTARESSLIRSPRPSLPPEYSAGGYGSSASYGRARNDSYGGYGGYDPSLLPRSTGSKIWSIIPALLLFSAAGLLGYLLYRFNNKVRNNKNEIVSEYTHVREFL